MRNRCSCACAWTWSLVVWILLFVSVLPAAGQSLQIDRERAEEILAIVSRDIEKNFYDPTLHGLDWQALQAQALDRIEKAQSNGEMFTAI